ncbi:MAG: DUF2971 domain-containing protein [Myxococcales bacterium]
MEEERLEPSVAAIRDRVIKAGLDLTKNIGEEALGPPEGPPSLYHYTTAAGLLGILRSGHIHVSRASSLNDTRELKYGENLAREILRVRAGQMKCDAGTVGLVKALHEQALMRVASPLDKPSESGWIGNVRLDPFVASFSEEPDLIGMWAYFAKSGGYCLGFKRSELAKTVGLDSFQLSRVIYDEEVQRRTFESAMERFEQLAADQLSTETIPHQIIGAMVLAYLLKIVFRNLAVRMKAPAFQNEKEWRLITFAMEGADTPDPHGEEDATHMSFREMGNRIVPYFKAGYAEGRVPLCSVRSGPTVDGSLAKDSIARVLKASKYPWRDIDIMSSDISLRE